GLSYVPAVGAVQRWFVAKRGLASGIAVSGIGVGTLVVPKVAEWLIEAFSWRGAFLILGLFALVGGGAAALLIDGAPERRGMLPDGGVSDMSLAASPPAEGVSLSETVRSTAFRMLY